MLARDVRVEDFDAGDWITLGAILGARRRQTARSGGLVVLHDGVRVVKVLSTSRGRLPPDEDSLTAPLLLLADRHAASWVLRVTRAGLADLDRGLARSIARSDDFGAQGRKLTAVLQEVAERGDLEYFPRTTGPSGWETNLDLLERAVDAVCPRGRALLFAAFDGPEVATCIAIHRGNRGVDRVVGPALLRREVGLHSVDWQKNCSGLGRAVELSVGTLSLGCFAQKATWKSLVADPSPGAWAAAVAARDIVVHPVAAAIAIPLGLDVGRAAVAMARELAVRIGMESWFASDGPFGPAMGRVLEGKGEIERLLGSGAASLLRQLFGGGAPRR